MRMMDKRKPVGVKLTSPGMAEAEDAKVKQPSSTLEIENERNLDLSRIGLLT
jgi:hypothetical protein